MVLRLRVEGEPHPYMLNMPGEEYIISSLIYKYNNLEYVRIYGIYRVTQAEYVIRILMAASQEHVQHVGPQPLGLGLTLNPKRSTRLFWTEQS